MRLFTQARILFKSALLMVAAGALGAQAQDAATAKPTNAGSAITNLAQLTEIANRDERVIIPNIDLDATVLAASRSNIGVVILQDATGVELVELGSRQPRMAAGQKIRLSGTDCLLRRRDMGISISGSPVVDNDGVHVARAVSGEIYLTKGRHPLQLDWFNQFRDFSLVVTWQTAGGKAQEVPANLLWRMNGNTYSPGLDVQSYEGFWENVPGFELLKPSKSGVAGNFSTDFRSQNDMSGLRFTGFFDAPRDGNYIFQTLSDDGSLLYLDNLDASVNDLGKADMPKPAAATIGQPMADLNERRWVEVEGRVSFARNLGRGVEFELSSERDSMRVRIADAAGLNPVALLDSRIRVTGLGRGVFNLDRRIVLGQLVAASPKELEVVDRATVPVDGSSGPLTTAQQVQTLRLEDARRNLPVRIRGVVTSKGPPYDLWISVQDDTRGIFVDLHAVSNAAPVCGEEWEIIGHSGAGDFAPVLVADHVTRLGIGRMPAPARPTYDDLINGSMDVQWVEFRGVVTDVHTNMMSLLLPGGPLDVVMVEHSESELKKFQKAVVRIRGALYAAWNTGTRELRLGNILMHNATVDVDVPAPRNELDAVVKTPRELLFFDAQATAFRRVKVHGQVIHAEPGRLFLTAADEGIRVLPTGPMKVHAGDLVEAVGYPEISDISLLLREAYVQTNGYAPLPAPKVLSNDELTREDLDSTRVHVEGKLLGDHFEYGTHVLEMQSGTHLYLARVAPGMDTEGYTRIGSQLGLTGVYVAQKRTRPGVEAESFELLLNSPSDITVLSRPSSWTLQRLLVVVGVLFVILIFTLVWITQLRRVVDQRTAQLHREVRERERVERARALEAERSRIARDLHDDLGSSLTEINVLASAGQRTPVETNNYPSLFRAIGAKARSLIAALDVIVWAVDPEDNSLQSVADYLSGFANEYLSSSGIACRYKVPVKFPDTTLNGQVRHDLLMAVKETLNNIVRHSDATEVSFGMGVEDSALEIHINDNGRGFESGSVRDGHGLKNLSARLEKIGGICSVNSHVGVGTAVRIRLPLPASDETRYMSTHA